MDADDLYVTSSISIEMDEMEASNVTTNDSYPDICSTITTHVLKPWFNGLLIGGFMVILIIGILANAMVMIITLADQRNNQNNTAVRTINTYITNLASGKFKWGFLSFT